VRKAYWQNGLTELLSRVEGSAPYSALIQVKNKQVDVKLDSSLQGLALHLPTPLRKTKAENLPLHVELTNLPVDSAMGAAARDELNISLGKVLQAHYVRQKNADANSWSVIRGGIGVNAPAPMPESGVAAYFELASLNMEDLQTLLPDKASAPVSADNTAQRTDHVDLGLAQYLRLDEIAAHAIELTFLGKKLDQVVFGASRMNDVWQANIDSKQITGYLTWHDNERNLGYVTARLGSLVIPETAANDVVDLLQNKTIHTSMPGLDVIADNVELFGKKLGRLELQAKNIHASSTATRTEWQIDKLSLANADALLTAEGKWINNTDSSVSDSSISQTSMKYQLDLNNAGKLLDRFGYARVIAGGKGKLTGEINWSGSPYSLDTPTLSGKIRLDLQAGQFLKVEPGAAKLLAVLNLQALPRRLMLDFRDVFSNGFAFDGITGNAQIEHGVVKTDNLKMRSVSATVLLGGTADIAAETQNLHVVVAPEVNAGAASVVYGLAVNPVIGVGTFLAQLFLRDPLMKAFTFEYQITGPWKEPNVVKL
jgi:uncharacterized protein YhdP